MADALNEQLTLLLSMRANGTPFLDDAIRDMEEKLKQLAPAPAPAQQQQPQPQQPPAPSLHAAAAQPSLATAQPPAPHTTTHPQHMHPQMQLQRLQHLEHTQQAQLDLQQQKLSELLQQQGAAPQQPGAQPQPQVLPSQPAVQAPQPAHAPVGQWHQAPTPSAPAAAPAAATPTPAAAATAAAATATTALPQQQAALPARGAQHTDPSAQQGMQEVTTVKGDRVTKVAPNSPAALAGLVEGMRVVGVNGVPVGSDTKRIVSSVRQAWVQDAMYLHVVSSNSASTTPVNGSFGDTVTQHWQYPQGQTGDCGGGGSGSGGGGGAAAPGIHSPYGFPAAEVKGGSKGSVGGGTPLSGVPGGAGCEPNILTVTLTKQTEQEPFGARVKGNTVSKVDYSSSAARAGIREGMTVLCVNGKVVGKSSVAVVSAVRAAWAIGHPMEVTLREGRARTAHNVPNGSSRGRARSERSDGYSEGAGSSLGSSATAISCASDTSSEGGECEESGAVCTFLVDGEPAPWRTRRLAPGEAQTRGWCDRSYELHGLPSCVLGLLQIRPPHKSLPQGTVVTARFHADATCYMFYSKALGRNGGFPVLVAEGAATGWEDAGEAPSWSGSPVSALGLRMIKKDFTEDEVFEFPPTTTAQTTCGFFVDTRSELDRTTGSFASAALGAPTHGAAADDDDDDDDDDGDLVGGDGARGGCGGGDEDEDESPPASPHSASGIRSQTMPPPPKKQRPRSSTLDGSPPK